MRREYAPVAAMAVLLVASQAVAIALSPLFQSSGFQAFPNPSDVTNTAIYIILILVFTAVILGLVRYLRQNLAKYVLMASIFVTLAFVLLLPLYYGLYYGTGQNQDPNFQNLLANVATLLSFAVAAVLVYLLVKFPEWYVVDTIGFVTAAGVTAILGISFGLWLAILLVIPKKAGYSFREQKSLKGQIAAGEEREAMFIGLGDLIIPGILSVSAFTFLNDPTLLGRSFGPVAPFMTVALGTVIGSLVGFFVLMRYVLKGNPQAGLPLLNGGALLGFLVTSLVVYGTIHIV